MTLTRFALLAALVLFPSIAAAQSVSIDFGEGTLTGRSIQLFVLMTVLSLAPGIAIMITCFPFLVTVLSILRQAIGLQQAPPNMLIVSLALFLTYFVMEPVFTQAWTDGVAPMLSSALGPEEAFEKALVPFRSFMVARIDHATLQEILGWRDAVQPDIKAEDAPLAVLVPSFLLSEMSRAFQIGFLIFLPFVIIDLVVSAILMSMGMMMVPPAVVSLPFKLAFFVVADGWTLVAGALVNGYMTN